MFEPDTRCRVASASLRKGIGVGNGSRSARMEGGLQTGQPTSPTKRQTPLSRGGWYPVGKGGERGSLRANGEVDEARERRPQIPPPQTQVLDASFHKAAGTKSAEER